MLLDGAILYGLFVLIDVLRSAGTADVVPLCTAGSVFPYAIAPSPILWPEGRAVCVFPLVALIPHPVLVHWFVPWLVHCSLTIGQAPITFLFGICGTDPGT